VLFLQKAALEKRNKELKEWQDKQKDPGVEKMVRSPPLLSYSEYACMILKVWNTCVNRISSQV